MTMSPGYRTLVLVLVLVCARTALTLPLDGAKDNDDASASSLSCGVRLRPFIGAKGNSSSQEVVDSHHETFPWLASIKTSATTSGAVLCSGAFVSPSVLVVEAACVSKYEAAALQVGVASEAAESHFAVERIVIHPEYNSSHPSEQHNLAVLKISFVPTSSTGDSAVVIVHACLPEPGYDPVGGCQMASYGAKGAIRAQELSFAPSLSCIETPHLRGYVDASENIVCSEESLCDSSLRGPVFCEEKGRFKLAAVSVESDKWCAAGALTRVAKYAQWLQTNIQELEEKLMTLERQEHSAADRDFGNEDANSADLPCAATPCGTNAVCWNSGSRYFCTCDSRFPHGNAYTACHECLFDSQCKSSPSSSCANNTCTQPPVAMPREYVKVGDKHYLVSEEALPWPQAQYVCLNRQGHLVELLDDRDVVNVASLLGRANATGRFWVGASDFEEEGKFRWYHAATELAPRRWDANGRPPANAHEDTDQRCVQISATGGKWVASGCQTEARFVCQHSESIEVDQSLEEDLLLGAGSSSRSSGRARTERQRSFDTLSPRAHYKDICGRRFVRQSRIVGGGVADYGEWPWQVSLKQFKSGQFRHKCGAALLTHDWVVTAAHCVKDVSPSNLMVSVGEYNVLDEAEAHPAIERRVTRVITHVSFDKFSYEYDIALLLMVQPVDFQPNIIPVCLPSFDENNDLVGETGTVTGWGRRTEFGSISPVLREVHLPIISNSKCMSLYRRSGQNEWIPRIFICAGTANGGEDSCEGDSGGPMVIKGKNGRYELVGVISWGIGCGDRNRPGVYTRITEFKNWIIRNANY